MSEICRRGITDLHLLFIHDLVPVFEHVERSPFFNTHDIAYCCGDTHVFGSAQSNNGSTIDLFHV